jgi:predicted nucleic acid-binding protein
MIVLDTSILIDALIPFNIDRNRKSIMVLDIISEKNLDIFEPKLFIIELSAVLIRYKSREIVVKHVNDIIRYVNLIDYNQLHNTALNIVLNTGCRAIDAFFIACAKETNSILISSDKIQVTNARKAGIEAYNLLKEYQLLLNKLQRL